MRYLAAVLALAVIGQAHKMLDDGFTFDVPEDIKEIQPVSVATTVQRRQNHEYRAVVGRVFHLVLDPLYHDWMVKKLPHWMIFNKKTSTLWGVPLSEDTGLITIKLISPQNRLDILHVKIINNDEDPSKKCTNDEDHTVLTLLLDKKARAIKPRQRVMSISNIAKFFRLSYSAFKLSPQPIDDDNIDDSSVVLAGPGNVVTKQSKLITRLEVTVGCDGKLWTNTEEIVKNLKSQAKDGTISEVLRMPVIGWRVKTDTKPILRRKRQATIADDYGSGDYDDEYYDYEDGADEESDLGVVEPQPPTTPKAVSSSTTMTSTMATSTHAHRHHHGESGVGNDSKVVTVPTLDEIAPTKFNLDADQEYDYDNYGDDDDDEESETEVPDISKGVTTVSAATTVEIVEDTEPPTYFFTVPSTTAELSSTSSTTTEAAATTQLLTTIEDVSTASTTEAITSTTTTVSSSSTTEEPTTTEEASTSTTTRRSTTVSNTKPYIENRLQFKTVTAGKVFRFSIPQNTFKDAEDGYNLTIVVMDANQQPLSKTSWLQFNPVRKELYGLPLAEDVSNWVYLIRAKDKDGNFEEDQLTIQVQQHRLERVVNHEFLLNLRIEKPQEYQHYVDWSLKILRVLGKIYNTNMSEITVRHINTTSDPVEFVWSNDSLPTSFCPRSDIEELFQKMTANDRGDPSRELSTSLAPDLRAKKVVLKELTICEQTPPVPVTPTTTNFSPILRNPVDKVNATLGELLVFKVKDDTFYDPEDVDPATLNITLLTADLQPIPSDSWLQFDSKNREFYGIPRRTGRTEYFLLCVDTGGMSAKDSLEVVVYPASKRSYNVEFSMTITLPLETFSMSTVLQRKFVEKLMEIFEESSPSNLHFLPFKAKKESNFESTIIYWFNKSLPVDYCPIEQIKLLESMLHNSESRSISSRVHRIMGPEFTVSTIKVHHVGNCKLKSPTVPPHNQPPVVVVVPEMTAIPPSELPKPQAEHDLMITLVLPIIIVAIMLLVAVLAACILYRKRRTGKANVEEDGRQSYGNKGIPVIFQEELEEKPEPGTKAPVILKDEKPPLAPPEYSKSGSLKLEDSSEPYQPPPPFPRSQDSGRTPRPKPTPTYRKPPPYVPP